MDKKADFLTFSRRPEEIPQDLHLSDEFLPKLIFLKAGSGSHILGFYTLENSLLKNPTIVFPNIGPEALIPNISTYTFPFGIKDKSVGFFLINNGFSLNKNISLFTDIALGRNGSLCFMERIANWRAIPKRNENGELIWIDRYTNNFIAFCTPASDKSKNPILLWLSNEGKIEILSGHIFHTIAKEGSERLLLNPDGYVHSAIYFDAGGDSLTIGFCELLSPEKKLFNDVRFKFMIGAKNYCSLFPQSIAPDISLSELVVEEIDSISLCLTKDSSEGDVFRPFGFFVDENGAIEDTKITLTNLDEQGCIILEGSDSKSTYENVLQHIRLTNLFDKDKKDKKDKIKRTIKITVKSQEKTFNAEILSIPDSTLTDAVSLSKGNQLLLQTNQSDNSKRGQDIKMSDNKAEEVNSSKIEISETKLNIKPLERKAEGSNIRDNSSVNKRIVPSPLAERERRTVLVTGAAKRIGKEISLCFASEGWNVIVHCNSSINEARELAKEISKYGVRSAVLQADFSDDKEVRQIFPEVFKVFPEVDCLINNASVFETDTFQNASNYSISRHMQINLLSPLILMQDFAKQFSAKDGRKGNIINITDAMTKSPSQKYFSYSLSKTAFAELTKITAVSLAPEVRVNAIAPWLVLPSPSLPVREMEEQIAKSPLGQKTSSADIFKSIKFIIDSPSITGQTIFLDGGNYL